MTIIDMHPVSVSSILISSLLIIFNCQAVDTFLESLQCLDIKDYKSFDEEWDVLVDIAHVLKVKSQKNLML